MLPIWKKWTKRADDDPAHVRIGVSTTSGPHERTCLQMGCDEAPTHGYVVPVRCYGHALCGMKRLDPETTPHEAARDRAGDPV